MMLCLSWLSRAQPNWAAPAYVSAIVLVVGWALAQGWRRWVGVSVAVNIAVAVAAFGATDALAGRRSPGSGQIRSAAPAARLAGIG